MNKIMELERDLESLKNNAETLKNEGKIDEALLFCGSNAYRCEKIETVPEVMAALCGE